jgi:hypothetical protein
MKIILTDKQYNFILEQRSDFAMDRQSNAMLRSSGIRSKEDYNTTNQVIKSASTTNIDPHTLMTILQIGTAFIPFVGPFISAGLGLAEAGLYYQEGDKKTAGMIGLFSAIPGVGGLSGKLGLGKWSAKALGEIGKKISLGSKLTSAEIQVVNRVAQYRQLIQTEMTKFSKSAIVKGIANTVKTIAGYGAVGAGYSKGYDYVQRGTPKVKAETEGLDWNFVRSSFGSSGTKEENELLNKAWAKGWRPGQVVPKEFQTKQYQTQYSEDEKNIKLLQQLIAQAK